MLTKQRKERINYQSKNEHDENATAIDDKK